jgi:murein L,D-transpeptidase YafK
MTRRGHTISRGLAIFSAFAAAGALTADTLAMSSKPLRTTKQVERRLEGAEAAVVAILKDIAGNRIGSAQAELDRLIASRPDFRLAQLIKGDLLLARSRPIETLGSAPDAPEDRLRDLRDEAKARILRLQNDAPRDRLPRYLLKLAPEQKFAIVVDTSRSSLYLFANHDGTPQYVADYYITIGKNGTEKVREGDKKTPLGVYRVTGNLPASRIGDFYGSGAYPISYPNEWDRRQGRDGHGIWLHGTPSDTYSRPPRASDGCVVLTNEDLTAIARDLQIGTTPVIISGGIDWVAEQDLGRVRASLESSVEQWRSDWESLRTGNYLDHYAPTFSTGTSNLAEWAAQKRAVNSGKTWIKVRLDAVSMFLYPGREPLAVVDFTQDYSSSNLSNVMKKRQYWLREGSGWKIVYEGAA